VTGRRGTRHKQLPQDLKEKNGYWKVEEEALDLTLRRTRFGMGQWTCRKADCGMSEYVTFEAHVIHPHFVCVIIHNVIQRLSLITADRCSLSIVKLMRTARHCNLVGLS
jgi:hypothetical protein